MALTTQGKEFSAKTFPFTQPASFNASRYSSVPWGQAIVNESFQTTTIGAGDTGLIIIALELPSDYVAMLRNFHLQIVDTAGISWASCQMGFAYQQPGGPYKNSIAEYPEDEYSWYNLTKGDYVTPDRFGTNRFISLWNFGGGETNTNSFEAFNDAWDPTQLPLWIPPSVDASFKQRSVVIFLANPSASQPAQELTIRSSFDLFTFEQAYSAAVMSSPRVFT